MAYYQKVLQPDETVVAVGNLHWVIYGRALVCFGLAVLALVLTWWFPAAELGDEIVAAVLFCLGLIALLHAWIIRKTTEVVVTDRRIIHKRGLISRHTEEMNITKVETVDVDQGITGRVLGYGTLVVHGTGGGWEPLHRLAAPLRLRNAIIAG
jgi:uncharacterized membrane protein YdbT with pleckstrin-like domain